MPFTVILPAPNPIVEVALALGRFMVTLPLTVSVLVAEAKLRIP